MGIEECRVPSRETYRVLHSKELKLEDMGSFLYHPGFWEEWKALKLNDDDLRELEVSLVVDRDDAGELQGCGGLRYRVVTPEAAAGREQRAVVVYYYYLEQRSITYVISIDQNINAMLRLTAADRRVLRNLAVEIERTEGLPLR